MSIDRLGASPLKVLGPVWGGHVRVWSRPRTMPPVQVIELHAGGIPKIQNKTD